VLRTPLCDTLGIDLPIWNAGMGGGAAGAELVAAVSDAGGFGVLGTAGLPAPVVREEIRRLRELTDRPFGLNVVLALLDEEHVDLALAEGAAALVLFWGDAAPFVERAHAADVRVIVQVGSADEARAAADAGVDAVMIQGVEAGGHVRGTTGLSVALPATVEAVAPLPVIAAGGVADGRGLVAALDLGAQAVSMGTRFLCSEESRVWGPYKERIAAARAEDTVLTGLFDVGWPDAPHRVLRNRAVEEWERAGSPGPGRRPGEGDVVARFPLAGQTVELPRYHLSMPLEGLEGDMEDMCLHAGESCALIDDVRPAAEIVAEVASEAEAVLASRV
jgi:NAD(P)H-dependent flavin oxidoreductase YrpB (nitropropane dioxygenase family)